MLKRFFSLTAILGGLTVATTSTFATDLRVQMFPVTGEIRFVNNNAVDLPFVFYSIASDSGALDASSLVWKSISANYDTASGPTPGNGFIDPNGEWLLLPSDSTMLAEGAEDLDGGRLPAYRAISLGNIWNAYATPIPDLEIEVWNDFEMIPITVELALDGDYSHDFIVDLDDYVVWRINENSTTSPMVDGNLDGIVDEADYFIWYANFGMSMPQPPYEMGGGSGVVNVVPEPATAVLFTLALGSLAMLDARRPRTSRRA